MNGFLIEIFGSEFIFSSDRPEILAACLETCYGPYRRTLCRRKQSEDNSSAYCLQISHDAPQAPAPPANGEFVNIPVRDIDTTANLMWHADQKKGNISLPADEARTAARLLFSAVAAFVQTAMWEHGILFFHAAAVDYNGKGILTAGANGSGKSTLMRSLLSHGASYLADDSAPLRKDGDKIEILPCPESVTIKELPEKETAILLGAGFRKSSDSRFLFPSAGVRPSPLRAVFFPQWAQAGEELVSLTKKETMIKILKLHKTPQRTEKDYSGLMDVCGDIAEHTAGVRIRIERGKEFPVEKILKFCDGL